MIAKQSHRGAPDYRGRDVGRNGKRMWSSDYPHWDFDLPSVIYDLPFLKEDAKRNILGGNAARPFGLDPKPMKKIP
jgi:predicted TIM-barrel fold metal-dependent hydrolase